MNSEAVLTIKRMGYTEDKIRKAIDTLKSRLPRGGQLSISFKVTRANAKVKVF